MLSVIMLSVLMLNVLMLNVFILKVVMLSVVTLNVVTLSVVAPLFSAEATSEKKKKKKRFFFGIDTWTPRSMATWSLDEDISIPLSRSLPELLELVSSEIPDEEQSDIIRPRSHRARRRPDD
jgi:hypothetical protein